MQEPTPFLEELRIASPCTASWDAMVGDDRVRFCGACQKNVYDLRNMSRAEAEELVRGEGSACVRMARRADGTVVTNDCPIGSQQRARRQRAFGVAAGGLLAASALLWKVKAEAEPGPGHRLTSTHEFDYLAKVEAKLVAHMPKPIETGQVRMGAVARLPQEAESPKRP